MTRLLYLLLIMLALSGAYAAFAPADDEIALQVRRISASGAVGKERLRSGAALERFYQGRQYQPAWTDGSQILPLADVLMGALVSAEAEGFDPDEYHLAPLTDRCRHFRAIPTPEMAAELDILFSDAYLTLASHYLRGRIAPARVDPDWYIPRQMQDLAQLLSQALASGRINDSLQSLLPTDPSYAALRLAWQALRFVAVNGGWPHLKLPLPLRPGATGPEVAALRQRLAMAGDLPADAASGDLFDDGLEAAVRRFQVRHGLEADGVIGPRTLDTLNVPAAERTRQLALNLERRRWLPRSFGERYLLINLPAFNLQLVQGGAPVLEMRVIVGRQLRPTPTFTGEMTYLVLNPYWDVPHRLAVQDHLPRIQKSRSYLKKNDFVVMAGGRQVDPATIDWQKLGEKNFPYRLRQSPGEKNSLGRVKFIFANPHAIYLHDTPSRELFQHAQRSFSSGCIRIEKPLELARMLLDGTPLGSAEALDEELESAFNRTIHLPSSLPVYLLYLTAWVDADGSVNFRPDLYGRDTEELWDQLLY
jgi:murein L,D-transpeptidase YcbB/YkuD